MSDYLPNQLWMEIFIRLPMKSILRCTGVCHSWKYLIKSQEFITCHLNFKIENEAHNSCLLMHSYCKSKEETFTFYDENNRPMDILSELNSPFEAQNKFFQIVGTCNGFLCFSDNFNDCYDNVIVWNPLVRKSMYLPRPNCSCEYNDHWFGFGYDSVERDYKVVSIVCKKNAENHVEIFKLSTHGWENISDRALGTFTFLTNGQIYLNGSIHWIGKVKGNHNNVARNIIVLFDVCEESFRVMELPETLATYPHHMMVAVYRGSFAIVVDEVMKYSIWTMTEYGSLESWNKQVCLYRCAFNRWPYYGFMKNGDILSIKVNGDLGSYDPITRKYNLLREHAVSVPDLHDSFCYIYATPYLESLVFIDKGANFSNTATAEKLTAANGYWNLHNVRFQNFMLFFSGDADPSI